MRQGRETASTAHRSFGRWVRILAAVGFAAGLAVVALLTLLPSAHVPATALPDKLGHFLAYFVLAVLGRLAFQGPFSLAVVLIGLPLYGGALELAQWGMGVGRWAEIRDAAANGLGAWAGSFAYSIARRISAAAAR
jgi:VanZ family protein